MPRGAKITAVRSFAVHGARALNQVGARAVTAMTGRPEALISLLSRAVLTTLASVSADQVRQAQRLSGAG